MGRYRQLKKFAFEMLSALSLAMRFARRTFDKGLAPLRRERRAREVITRMVMRYVRNQRFLHAQKLSCKLAAAEGELEAARLRIVELESLVGATKLGAIGGPADEDPPRQKARTEMQPTAAAVE